MVHETDADVAQPLSVPEELFNLTQLANVTLAAGKLSTNNHEQIKEFIRTETKSNTLSIEQLHTNEGPRVENVKPPTKYHNNEQYQLFPSDAKKPFSDTPNDAVIMATIDDFDSKATFGYTAAANLNHHRLTSNISSSEDDSVYTNYVHKIFDKRKTRKLSYQSDDSEYEIGRMAVSMNRNDDGDKLLHHQHHRHIHRQLHHHHHHHHSSHHTDDSMPSSETESIDCTDKQNCGEDECGPDGDIHTCPECSKKYSTSSNLARHRQTHRSLMDKKARRCPHCDKVYVSMPAFSMHVRTHNQGCECPHCGKRFSRPWLLQGHIRTHTGEKPFQCSICAKAFADKSNLRAHIQTHSNTKPHTCARCGKAFALKSYLYKHEESSCMRNQSKPLPSAERDRPDASASPNLSASVAVNTLSKILKKAKPNVASDTQKRFKEKLRDKLKGGAALLSNCGSSIVTDAGSQKSYIDLNRSQVVAVPNEIEQYSRISVIRTALSTGGGIGSGGVGGGGGSQNGCGIDNGSAAFRESMALGFYQETPMDYSPKSKFHNTGTLATSGSFEIGRNYAMVA